MTYKQTQVARVRDLIQVGKVFNGDAGGGIFNGKTYPFVLQDAGNNLFAPVRQAVCDYMRKNDIAWWNGALTNHVLSSQVACLNHLFPLREDRQAVLALVRQVCPAITDVLRIESDRYLPAYIQFEATSDADHLNEIVTTRGQHCTSLDALILGVHRDGRRILFPIEWKYVEAYGNDNKAAGAAGATRRARYTALIDGSAQLDRTCQETYYFEPFYQLMRQTLWAEQLVAHRSEETVQADDFIHIHVVPAGNRELLHKRYPGGKGMEATWRDCLRDQGQYVIVTPGALRAPLAGGPHDALCDYLNMRYG
ncbi:MAG: hypothetical protein GX112_15430 [Clostridiaceae bacterium]|jgi:hypothetical protein|nr:hypothetical protein [Clostridiaceae bacterium]